MIISNEAEFPKDDANIISPTLIQCLEVFLEILLLSLGMKIMKSFRLRFLQEWSVRPRVRNSPRKSAKMIALGVTMTSVLADRVVWPCRALRDPTARR